MKIGEQAGLPRGVMQSWYEKVILGEMLIAEFFLLIRQRMKSHPLLPTLDALIHSLPKFIDEGSNVEIQ